MDDHGWKARMELARQWEAAVDDAVQNAAAPPPAPVDAVVELVRMGESLGELATLALLDEIIALRPRPPSTRARRDVEAIGGAIARISGRRYRVEWQRLDEESLVEVRRMLRDFDDASARARHRAAPRG